MFPFKERKGHTFVQNVGYGDWNDRRQTAVLVEAFTRLKYKDVRLILKSQNGFRPGVKVDDPRIEYRQHDAKNPADNYLDGDIAILPMAYEGYGRTVLESMASGMPTLTTDADPMNLFQHDRDFLLSPDSSRVVSGRGVKETVFNQILVKSLHSKLEQLLMIDTRKYSHWARRQAEGQSWESQDTDYKAIWMEVLEGLL
jgi:glycosyltransferase involved in cell wall biosynthesis